ncbi:Tat pathway signal sequence domain protein [Luminiphilus syltensis NOR5-1B]|uniref:Tat pathway signal sequence domain protein n=1 Tax=Luminiphilus syltensis NOR5-1B TaxID=565045 RepID=B8KX45_9GAMM|nr:thiosulfate oxidation carrier protein SoxY [Luminiphilus syltensis]EED36886.1 Tat pathway signal sequence domain protein [Luminiphilus syltensis NOR5-1B]
MNQTETFGPIGRRQFLRAGAAFAALAIAPIKLLASMVRPEGAFQATTVEATLAELGMQPVESSDIVLETPNIAENGAVVPVTVTSSIPNTSRIFVMVEKNPNPLAAIFDIPEGTEASVQTRVKVAQTCLLYGLVEADGKLYMTTRETKVTLGGCGG